jgi:hypothetical protein
MFVYALDFEAPGRLIEIHTLAGPEGLFATTPRHEARTGIKAARRHMNRAILFMLHLPSSKS